MSKNIKYLFFDFQNQIVSLIKAVFWLLNQLVPDT